MTDSTKTGLAVGGAAALIGLVASFLCYKEGHAAGHSEGLAKGGALFKKKYEDLRQKVEEQEKLIQGLQKVKQQVLSDQNVLKATVGELCNNLRGLVSDEVYHKMAANLSRTGSKGVAGILDEAVEVLKEGKNAINGSPAKGRIVGAGKFSGSASRITPPHYESGLRSFWKESYSETQIVFSPDIKGWYFWPQFEKRLLPDDKVLCECPHLLKRIQELIPGWSFDNRKRYAEIESKNRFRDTTKSEKLIELRRKNDYDVMAICANAMHELEGRAFPCGRVEFDKCKVEYEFNEEHRNLHDMLYTLSSLSGRDPSENDRVDIDYENGTVFCKELDEYLTQKCDEVAEAINAFWNLMPDADREEMEKCRKIHEAISRGDDVTGTLRIVDGAPVISFCRDLNISLKISDKKPLYFEGEGLTVDKNKDLRKLFQKILPAWKNAPISDGRILGVIGNVKEFHRMRREKPQLPARGAVREHLRFEDAGTLLRNKILKSYEGRDFTCEYVSLERENGVVTAASTASSRELTQLLEREFEAAQNSLNDFAVARNGRLYSSDDLFPRYTDQVYYKKWDKVDRLTEQGRHRVGDVVDGVVREIKDYGAFVDFDNMSGLLHISNIRDEYIRDIRKVLSVGQKVKVKIIKMDNGKIELSMKKKGPKRNKVSSRHGGALIP